VTAAVARAVARLAGEPVANLVRVGGGDVSAAFRATTGGGASLFVKHHAQAPAGMFEAESRGLEWLRSAAALRVPRVLGTSSDPPLIVLEWIEGAPGPAYDDLLGHSLAALHAAGAPRFGADADNFIATLPQPNAPTDAWHRFYGERRLAPLTAALRDGGRLGAAHAGRLDRLVGRLEDLCGPEERPARLHGDLWAGNALADENGSPVLVDPAVYGGHREVDLAMMRLFGGFGARVFAAYQEVTPLSAGHADRVALYQVWPLLVHVALFGAAYAERLHAAVRRYVG
jgi:fructosamine-3-kinase